MKNLFSTVIKSVPGIILSLAVIVSLDSCSKSSGTSTSIPAVTTANITDITDSTAISGGEVTADGGTTVSSRGVCWKTSPGATIVDNKTADGSGTGTFTSSLTNLLPNTTYYLKAYAINDVGTAYGSEKIFTTLQAGQTLHDVNIQNFAFSPASLTVPVNTTVTWTNKDASMHTVTSDTGLFNSTDLATNATFSFKFTTAGTYTYHCAIHTYMTGTIIVQ